MYQLVKKPLRAAEEIPQIKVGPGLQHLVDACAREDERRMRREREDEKIERMRGGREDERRERED